MKLWIKEPLAIFAPGLNASAGLLIEDGLITAVLDRPPEHFDECFDASALVVLPGLINGHHHFYQTLTRAVPAACLLYTSPSPRDAHESRMPSSA